MNTFRGLLIWESKDAQINTFQIPFQDSNLLYTSK